MAPPVFVQIKNAIRDMNVQDLTIVWLSVTDVLPGFDIPPGLSPVHKEVTDLFSQLDTKRYFAMQIELGSLMSRKMEKLLRDASSRAIKG